MLPFSVVLDEGWNGKCPRNEITFVLSRLSYISGEATHVAGAP